MWLKCKRLGVAAITYRPLMKVDLSTHPEPAPKMLWGKLSPSQSASLHRVAYEMRTGDVIYVKEGPQIVGRGVVRGSYRFDSRFRLIDYYGSAWAHQVPVRWDRNFPVVEILLGAEPLTVKKLSANDVRKIEAMLRKANKSNRQTGTKKEIEAITNSLPQYWWVMANEHSKHPWHWDRFFENPDNSDEAYDWGGPEWIKSRMSFGRIKEMCKGDMVIAYQADEGVVGLAYLASNGYKHARSKNFDTFDLKSSPAIWLGESVPYSEIRNLPNAKEHIEFIKANRGTVFRIDVTGFRMILDLILKLNPSQRGEIQKFLSVKQFALEGEPIAVDETGKLILPPKATFTFQRVVRDSTIGKGLKRR
jgi:hypothetical protein